MMNTMIKQKFFARIKEEVYTFCAFGIAVSLLPALAVSYVVVRICKNLWLKFLCNRYPHLEFIKTSTVRSLLDTHRNQGIINVLLCIKGSPDYEEIKQHLTYHVLDRRDNHSNLMFPRLRHVLASCWGNYAWSRSEEFKPEAHFIIANSIHRGRPVSDSNIQEYVSEIVSKYFPVDQPPWQYIIIPCVSNEPKYYILVRVHHLLLTGRKSLNIGDLLMVEQLKPARTEPQETPKQSPLTKLFPHPSAIPELWGRLNEHISNAWNELISEYDPVESPRALKTMPGVFHVAGMIMIAGASALREMAKRRQSGADSNKEPLALIKAFLVAIRRECKRRSLSINKVLLSPLVTVDPRKWPFRTFNTFMRIMKIFVNLPFRIWDEIACLIEVKETGVPMHPNTFTWKYAELVQLVIRASAEATKGLVEIYRAPASLWTDAIAGDDGKSNFLQTTSLCGRKVAAWSNPILRTDIERAAKALGVSSTDIALYATTEALRAFFEQTQTEQPDHILATARAAPEDFLFTFSEGYGKDLKKSQTGGMICLSLPVGATPRRIASVIESACKRQAALAGAWVAQARYGALTRAVPSMLARLTLNLLSRRYAVSYAEIDSPMNSKKRTTLWSQEVDYLVYWRPPQANISMSLTVLQYADSVRLSVMTDAQLSPNQVIPANRWSSAVSQLVGKIDQELLRIAAHSSNAPRIVTTYSTEEPTDSQNVENLETSQSMGMLKPPTVSIASPPPLRRNLTHN